MAFECSECDRSFVEDYLLANHEVVVHGDDLAVHRAEGQVVAGESQSSIAARAAAARGERADSMFVKDVTIPHDEDKQVSDKLAGVKQTDRPQDIAAEDSPKGQQYLMQAWQAIALYMANCDDENQSAALQVLKAISNLMSNNDEPNQPQPIGAFGTTSYAALDMACQRTFPTEQGFINHVKQVHGKKENV